MQVTYQTIVVGAGPAGLAAAEILARQAHDVLIVEKNDIVGPKVCAGFLPYDERTEESFGRPDKIFSTIKLHTGKRHFELSTYRPFLAVYDRGNLGQHMLTSAVKAGAEVITGALVKQISQSHVNINGIGVKYQYLIGADGSNSIVRRKLGIPTTRTGTTFQFVVPRLSEQFELYLDYQQFGLGCGWVVPHAEHTLIGLGRDMDPKKKWPIGDQCRRWVESLGWDVDGVPTQSWPISYDYRGWRFGNVFLAGDAGGFASGLTGEGIANAIISGRSAANTIISNSYRPSELMRALRRKEQHERLMRVIRLSPRLADNVLSSVLPRFRRGYRAERFVKFLFHAELDT